MDKQTSTEKQKIKMKQTAVEFLVEKLKSQDLLIGEPDNLVAVRQAKEIEEQQKDEYAVLFTEWLNKIKVSDNQTYYNNTLGELLVIFKNK
jgi:hypothetical protein